MSTPVICRTQYASSVKLVSLCNSPALKEEILNGHRRHVHNVAGRRVAHVKCAEGIPKESKAIPSNEWSADTELTSRMRCPQSWAQESSEEMTKEARSAGDEAALNQATSRVANEPMGSGLIGSPKDSMVSLQESINNDGTSLFTRSSHSSLSTAFDEEQFLAMVPERATVDESFLCGYPYMAAHKYCSHGAEDYIMCPRCQRVCVREFSLSDAVICVWCFNEGAADDNCWFCSKCGTTTGTGGKDDAHYRVWDCTSKFGANNKREADVTS